MPMEKPAYMENLEKYGPGTSGKVKDVEKMTALASGRPEREDIYEENFRAIAGKPSKAIKELVQEAKELGDQYKREARGVEKPESSISKKLLTNLGFKHGGKISTAEKNSACKGW